MNEKYLKIMNKLINKAIKKDEAPVAAIIEYNGKIIAKAINRRNKTNNTIDHAEIIAITKVNKKLKNWRANKCTMYVTLEPCDMCMGVIKESRISKLYYLQKRENYKKQYSQLEIGQIELSKEQQTTNNNMSKIIKNYWKSKR